MAFKASFTLSIEQLSLNYDTQIEIEQYLKYLYTRRNFTLLPSVNNPVNYEYRFIMSGSKNQFMYKLSNVFKKEALNNFKQNKPKNLLRVYIYNKNLGILTLEQGELVFRNNRFELANHTIIDKTNEISDNLLIEQHLASGWLYWEDNLRYKLYKMYPKIKDQLPPLKDRVEFYDKIVQIIEHHPKTQRQITFEHARDPEFLIQLFKDGENYATN